MRIELIIFRQVIAKQSIFLNIHCLFGNCFLAKRSTFGIGTKICLGKVYNDPKHAALFGSAAKLVKASKNNKRAVEEWLSGQDTYSLHKPVRKRFPRHPYTVTYIDDVWQMDLAHLSSLSKYNNKYKYLLIIIDIF